MYPTLIDRFGLKIHAYPAMLALAFLTCTLLTVRDLNRRDPPIPGNPQGGLWGFLGALVGAKIYWILQYAEPKYLWQLAVIWKGELFGHPLQIRLPGALLIWEGGLVFYGGLIGGVLALYAYLVIHKLPRLKVVDTVAPYLALGEAITRIGCFLNGCCWGRTTTMPWGVRFPKYSHVFQSQHLDASATASLPVHPAQLYMTFGLLGAMLLMKYIAKRQHPDGAILLLYLMLYGIVRFTNEAFRDDCSRSVFGMTVSQAISVALFVIGSAGLLVLYKRHASRKPSVAPEASPPEAVETTDAP